MPKIKVYLPIAVVFISVYFPKKKRQTIIGGPPLIDCEVFHYDRKLIREISYRFIYFFGDAGLDLTPDPTANAKSKNYTVQFHERDGFSIIIIVDTYHHRR